jgi:hypothetical protein
VHGPNCPILWKYEAGIWISNNNYAHLLYPVKMFAILLFSIHPKDIIYPYYGSGFPGAGSVLACADLGRGGLGDNRSILARIRGWRGVVSLLKDPVRCRREKDDG